ncbi:MAG: 6-phosphogluconolactonase [Bacillota bacterium]|nr:6-phosphogluconolactonase [Bacillota bacterium]
MAERLVVRESLEELSFLAADWIREVAEAAVRLRGVFALGLSGGFTPVRTYQLLADPKAGPPLPWAATQVYWCDERCVPPDHPESNYGLAFKHLLSRVAIPLANVHRIRGEDAEPARAATQYDRLLPPRLDLLVLGIGEDGHTASLFPGSPALHDHVHRAAAVVAPKPPPRRITITPLVIEAAERLLVLAAGEGKAAAVARALSGPEDLDACPAQLARRGFWLLDRAAAANLEEGMHGR